MRNGKATAANVTENTCKNGAPKPNVCLTPKSRTRNIFLLIFLYFPSAPFCIVLYFYYYIFVLYYIMLYVSFLVSL